MRVCVCCCVSVYLRGWLFVCERVCSRDYVCVCLRMLVVLLVHVCVCVCMFVYVACLVVRVFVCVCVVAVMCVYGFVCCVSV